MSQRDHLKNLIRTYNRRLQLLQEQQARQGLNSPPEIIMEIQDIEAKLDGLEEELKQAESSPEPLSPANELVYIQEQLTLLESAQHSASDPQRFQDKIEELKAVITNWEGRVEDQRQRIAEGLEKQQQETIGKELSKPGQKRVRVMGRPPLGEVEYFKDRQQERTIIGRLLAEPTTRLVSVIGQGGMGKTALASKVLADLERHRWPHTDEELPLDGIIYLSTRTAGISLERLFLDCVRLLGEAAEKRLTAIWANPKLGTEDKISHLLEALQSGTYVILLDNLEDLLDDQGLFIDQDLRLFFDRSLTTAHGVRLLVTSRITLAFKGEVMRFDRQVKLLDGLPVEDGVVLLRELDPNGDYGLRDAPTEQLSQAVSLVHGVPRALEVLVGILANDPFATLAEVTGQFYQQADVVQRLIEENYKRLDSQARRVIEALSVFKRPMPPLAVDYLLEPFFPGLDVPSILRRLTRTNILTIDRATKTVALHPIDQDYAYSQIPEEGSDELAFTRQALERRAADYYIKRRTPPKTWKNIGDLEPQLAEFEHRVRAGDYDDAGRVVELIDTGYLFVWGHYARLIQMRKELMGRLVNLSLQASNQSSLGRAYQNIGQVKQAIECYKEALGITRYISDRQGEGRLLGNLGLANYDLGQYEQAIRLQEEALLLAREVGDQWNEGVLLDQQGRAFRALGQIEKAINSYEKALDIAQKLGDRRGEASNLDNLGLAYHSLGQIKQAAEFYKKALDITREINYPRGEESALGSLGRAYQDLGQVNRSVELYTEAINIAREICNRQGESVWLNLLGRAYQELEILERAIKLQKQSLVIAHEINYRRGESYCLLGLGKTFLTIGKLSEAHQCFIEARRLNIPQNSHLAALMLGIVLLYQQDITAEKAFADAIDRSQTLLGKTISLYEPHYTLATALIGQAVCNPYWTQANVSTSLLTPALDEYHHALEICTASGVVREALRDLELIRAAGAEGLERVFELLQSRLKE